MKNYKMLLVAAVATLAGFASCSDDDSSTPVNDLKVTITMPLTVENAQIVSGTLKATNLATSKEYKQDTIENNTLTLRSLPVGVYNLDFEGKVKYNITTSDTTAVGTYATVKQTVSNYAVTESSTHQANTETMALQIYNSKEGLLLTEIFYTGTTTPEGKQYTKDQYFKVGNNSDDTLYLDGVAFVESDFLTSLKHDYRPDIMSDAMTIDAIYVFPGNGQDYPVAPGEEKLIAVNAIDHTEANQNSFDLSEADFEIYDESTIQSLLDPDNQNVVNMDCWYSYTNTYFVMNNQGYKAYALAKPEVGKEEFLANNFYKHVYTFVSASLVKDMEGEAYWLPNSWILDAVNLSVEAAYEWNVTSATLDAGWAYCGTVKSDKTRYGKSVIRKKNGTKWVDTNNSTEDFNSAVTASMLK